MLPDKQLRMGKMSRSEMIDIHQVMEILPHRYPFLLIDRVLDYTRGESLRAVKNVSVNEPFFSGHFPGRPVFPGVLVIEAIAQASAILARQSLQHDPGDNVIFLFAGIDSARFKRPVEPGDQLVLDVRPTHYKSRIWKYHGTGSVGGKMAAEANITFTYRNY